MEINAYLDDNNEIYATLDDTTVITDPTLSLPGVPADAAATGEAISAMRDGSVANADQLLSDQYTLDTEPYTYRKSFSGDREYDEIAGGTLAWNQLAPSNFTSSENGSFALTSGMSVVSGHKYMSIYKRNSAQSRTLLALYAKINGTTTNLGTVIDLPASGALSGASMLTVTNSATSDGTLNTLWIYRSGFTPVDTVSQWLLFDLTQMFGSTIADYLYTVEQSTAGAGVALAKKWANITKPYYAYNAGELISVSGLTGHEMVGFNQWDEDYALGFWNGNGIFSANTSGYMSNKTHIRVLPNTSYCFTCTRQNGVSFYLCYYDADKNFISRSTVAYQNRLFTTPSNCHYICFSTYADYGTTYNHNICISISQSKTDIYEPYKTWSYPLDSSLTLRGVPKLVNNKMAYDGDVYKADGTVIRNYGVRAYQAGDESDSTVITDKTNTVYKLNTPTTESATPYQSLQIVDENGTEAYTSTATIPIPVGHSTKYLENLRKKIEGLPWDLSMIAPIENGSTASQAYSTGQYFLRNNVFCKAKTSIASGASFTLNTNYQETTVAAELYTALH